MASANCWRCLSHTRPSQNGISVSLARSSAIPAAGFSTTSTALKGVAKPASGKASAKKKLVPLRKPGEQTTFKKKKKNIPQKTGKAPLPGERKAMRKRVVLSNTNALEVAGLRELDKQVLEEILKPGFEESKEKIGLLGSVVGLEGGTVDALRGVEAFKAAQGWGLFRRPGVLLRQDSVLLSRKLAEAEKSKSALRMVLDGGKGTGKSLMLVHALATAHLRGWVIATIPEAQELVTAATAYAPIPGTSPLLYSQNAYAATMLGQINKGNAAIFSKLETTIDLSTLPIPIPTKTITLARLCELGARDPDFAWPFFEALWTELTLPGRPPLLFTLDSLSHILRKSEYRSAKFEQIHALDLAVVKKFADMLSGATELPNGGAIIAATSHSHAPAAKSMTLALQQQEDRQAGREVTKFDPFERNYDARAEAVLKNIEVMRIGGLNKVEARGLMEYWAKSGVFRGVVDEKSVSEKWAVAGGGIVGEIERSTLRMRI